ncbi:hypothetical protein SAMN04488544_3743 [Microlunatus sagamiharensis]|uniref:Uncharacterized protein n=1 Tax=Microlunatus sagamiharensis TaxID=546874 RepID=A0A1H2ND50_9ACTN|nr:hypothetical protein [Microlunatus sagamiharensis]SDV03091.1 hypothetical protein SAMN04488544_3743 [Microlunatus sagamiharensis]
MSRHGPDPERLFFGRLVGTARQLAADQGSIADSIDVIRRTASGHEDLLVQGAGLGIGAWSVNPGLPTDILAASLLVGSMPRLELDVLLHWITVGQQRGLSGARYRA